MVAPPAPPASLMLMVPLVEAGVPFASNNMPPGLCTSTTIHLMAFAVFLAIWIGLRPTHSALSQGSSHK